MDRRWWTIVRGRLQLRDRSSAIVGDSDTARFQGREEGGSSRLCRSSLVMLAMEHDEFFVRRAWDIKPVESFYRDQIMMRTQWQFFG